MQVCDGLAQASPLPMDNTKSETVRTYRGQSVEKWAMGLVCTELFQPCCLGKMIENMAS